jgi:hypothetical protein
MYAPQAMQNRASLRIALEQFGQTMRSPTPASAGKRFV